MYELLTGSVPFKGDTAVEIALKHMKEKIPSVRKQNPTIPQSVENIILNKNDKLWQRRITDEDFLSVSLGKGKCKMKINMKN